MATEKKITSRIQQKHDVAANWAKATNFIPKKGEIIIYDAEYNASGEETQAVRFKIGDGSKTVNNLPFAVIDRTVKLGGGSAPSGATTPSSETVVNKLYVNKFLNSKSFRAICEWLDSDQILVMITTEYSAIYLHHCVGMFKSEITTSSSDITPVDTSNLGTYHFIIATEVYNTGTEVTRKVLYSERSGDAHFSYRDPVTGSTVTWEDTVDAGWSGMVNENYEYDAGGDYRIIIQPVYCGLDQGKTPVGNYFFAGSPFTVEYASSILSSVVTESVLGGDRDRGYYCNKTWRTNRLSGWRCYQTGNLIGDFPFNTDLNATACGTCFYNIIGEASNASEGSLQGTSLKRVILEANGAIITKVVPIVSNRADGNGDWTLCACSLYAGSTYAKYGLWVIPNPLTIEGPLGDSSEAVFWDNTWTFDTTTGFAPELNGPIDGKQVKYINFEALSLLNKYFIFTQQYETIRLSINEIADIQGKYALAMASSVGEISTSLINVEQSVSGKQDKITSANKLDSNLIKGLGAAAAKAVDTVISANSTSTNLPTSKAVEDRINAHSGIDKVGTVTGVKMNGTTKNPSSGVVDIGTVLTDASKFATAAQGSNADSALTKANANATEISNIKNGTTKVKSAEHADTADSATSAGTADKVANGLTLGGGVVYDGSKALSITAGDKMSITGGPGGVSIGLAHSVMPSTYNKVTVDGYGTVTAGENVDYLTSHQGIKKLNTNNTTAQDANASEAIAGSGTINLHKVAKTGSYNDLLYKPTIPTVNNGKLTIQKNGTDVATFTANQSANATANITVPTKVSELTNDSGYTTNKGTVTSVSVKMNGASKGTVTSSGTIDLGTVITAHQDISGKLDKTTYEVNKTIDFGSSGALYVGKFKVYDTNVTCEVTSTTNVTYSGKLVIATQNYAIAQMTVYGDAANTVAPNFFVKPSTTSNPYIEVYFKPSSWSKNVVHIYGSNIQAEPTNVCTNVPSVPSTATLKPKNALPTYSLSGTTLTITL